METQQRALLRAQHLYENGPDEYTIDLYLDVAYQGDGSDFAWVVPTPSLPEVSLVEAGFFDALDELTKPIVYYISGTSGPWRPCALGRRGELVVHSAAKSGDIRQLDTTDGSRATYWKCCCNGLLLTAENGVGRDLQVLRSFAFA